MPAPGRRRRPRPPGPGAAPGSGRQGRSGPGADSIELLADEAQVVEDEGQRIVDFVRHPGRQGAHRRHAPGVHQLILGVAQLAQVGVQLGVGQGQSAGPLGHPLLELAVEPAQGLLGRALGGDVPEEPDPPAGAPVGRDRSRVAIDYPPVDRRIFFPGWTRRMIMVQVEDPLDELVGVGQPWQHVCEQLVVVARASMPAGMDQMWAKRRLKPSTRRSGPMTRMPSGAASWMACRTPRLSTWSVAAVGAAHLVDQRLPDRRDRRLAPVGHPGAPAGVSAARAWFSARAVPSPAARAATTIPTACFPSSKLL